MSEMIFAPLTLVIDDTFGRWSGDVTGNVCAVTGEPSFGFDMYQTTDKQTALVSANASRKIQYFITRRKAAKISGPFDFVVYGRPVHIEDRRRSSYGGGAVISE